MPTRFEIPKGYKGWAFVIWERPAAPPLPVEDGHVVVSFSNAGVVQTSSSVPDGWATDEFFWVASDGNREPFGNTGTSLINGEGGGTQNPGSKSQIKYSYFYVGGGYSPSFTHDGSLQQVLPAIHEKR